MSNNGDEERLPNIVEDGPTMMSVSMMRPGMAPAIPLRSSGLIQKSSVRSHESLEPTLNEKLAPVVARTPWKVSKALAIPAFYELERTHVRVPDASALEISERVANFLYEVSIAAIYDCKQVCIDDVSYENKFQVRLTGAYISLLIDRLLRKRRLRIVSNSSCDFGKRRVKSL